MCAHALLTPVAAGVLHRAMATTRAGGKAMLAITVHHNDAELTLRLLKRQLQKSGLLRELRRRRQYGKPSERRRRQSARGSGTPANVRDWRTASTRVTLSIPTVSLDVIALVASSYGYDRGPIEHRVTQECAGHVATPRGLAQRPPHRHPPRAQRVAPLRERPCRRPRLPARRGTAQAPHGGQGHPGGCIRKEQRPHRYRCLMMRGPPADPLFAS
jgi:small subunit ribosomal protein S21